MAVHQTVFQLKPAPWHCFTAKQYATKYFLCPRKTEESPLAKTKASDRGFSLDPSLNTLIDQELPNEAF
jgi:hypothetical protein